MSALTHLQYKLWSPISDNLTVITELLKLKYIEEYNNPSWNEVTVCTVAK